MQETGMVQKLNEADVFDIDQDQAVLLLARFAILPNTDQVDQFQQLPVGSMKTLLGNILSDTFEGKAPAVTPPTEHTIRSGLMNAPKNSLITIESATLLSPPNYVILDFPAPTDAAPYWFVEIPQGLTFSKMINLVLHDQDVSTDWTVETADNALAGASVRIFERAVVGVGGRFRLEVTS